MTISTKRDAENLPKKQKMKKKSVLLASRWFLNVPISRRLQWKDTLDHGAVTQLEMLHI